MNTVFADILSRGTAIPRRLPEAREPTSMVFIVDDDAFVRHSLERLVATTGCDVECCASAEEFLCLAAPRVPACLLLDMTLPGTSGLELQRQIADRTEMPIIFITGHTDVRVTVQAMKAGAVDVLTKPVNSGVLLSGVECAIEISRAALLRNARIRVLRDCYQSLTPREREVMTLVVAGLLNKQVGGELGISEITVKAHRGQVMRKMKADSLADLVRMAARLDAREP
jgi:FixJ family two-component response regulator